MRRSSRNDEIIAKGFNRTRNDATRVRPRGDAGDRRSRQGRRVVAAGRMHALRHPGALRDVRRRDDPGAAQAVGVWRPRTEKRRRIKSIVALFDQKFNHSGRGRRRRSRGRVGASC
ncbi:MAG: hypothetical protein MZU97_21970 [Bacillus subtilis]|nr:hypothetical protein [Bacillus subtilis]